MKYINRQHAGRMLADLLIDYESVEDVVVLGLPRGGIPVAYEIASKINKPLDVFIVRKLGLPTHKELAMGACASGGIVFWNNHILESIGVAEDEKRLILQLEQAELNRREVLYRGNRPFLNLEGKTIILVDDGIATGSTMKAAIIALKQKQPKNIIVAVPVAAFDTCLEIRPLVKNFICPMQPHEFYAVGAWYENFMQTTDEEVIQLLSQSN